jgi:hypothetical protein
MRKPALQKRLEQMQDAWEEQKSRETKQIFRTEKSLAQAHSKHKRKFMMVYENLRKRVHSKRTKVKAAKIVDSLLVSKNAGEALMAWGRKEGLI